VTIRVLWFWRSRTVQLS
jgi:hypothetical protein